MTTDNLRDAIRQLTLESEQCTKDAELTYPGSQMFAQRTAHLDWHRGYRAALRDVAKAMEKDASARCGSL